MKWAKAVILPGLLLWRSGARRALRWRCRIRQKGERQPDIHDGASFWAKHVSVEKSCRHATVFDHAAWRNGALGAGLVAAWLLLRAIHTHRLHAVRHSKRASCVQGRNQNPKRNTCTNEHSEEGPANPGQHVSTVSEPLRICQITLSSSLRNRLVSAIMRPIFH